jgi:hypothetical protein
MPDDSNAPETRPKFIWIYYGTQVLYREPGRQEIYTLDGGTGLMNRWQGADGFHRAWMSETGPTPRLRNANTELGGKGQASVNEFFDDVVMRDNHRYYPSSQSTSFSSYQSVQGQPDTPSYRESSGRWSSPCSEYPEFQDKQPHPTHLALRFDRWSLNSADTCQVNREEQTLPLHARPGGSGEDVPAPCQPQAAPPARGILPLRVFIKVKLVLEEGYLDLPPHFGYQRTILLIRTRYGS